MMVQKRQNFSLRDATDQDYAFIERLYAETSAPLLSAFRCWDKEASLIMFKERYFRLDEAKIIVVDCISAGWLQVHENEQEIALHQIHLMPRYRNGAIGTRIISHIIGDAIAGRKKVTLSAYKNNPALNLYKRLGFEIASEDETKYHLVSSSCLREKRWA